MPILLKTGQAAATFLAYAEILRNSANQQADQLAMFKAMALIAPEISKATASAIKSSVENEAKAKFRESVGLMTAAVGSAGATAYGAKTAKGYDNLATSALENPAMSANVTRIGGQPLPAAEMQARLGSRAEPGAGAGRAGHDSVDIDARVGQNNASAPQEGVVWNKAEAKENSDRHLTNAKAARDSFAAVSQIVSQVTQGAAGTAASASIEQKAEEDATQTLAKGADEQNTRNIQLAEKLREMQHESSREAKEMRAQVLNAMRM